jgi:hypothetical protein
MLSAQKKMKEDSLNHLQWPQPISNEVIAKCLGEYYHATIWTPPPTCAICARCRDNLNYEILEVSSVNTYNIEVLRATEPTLIRLCGPNFSYGSPLIEGLVLEAGGLTFVTDELIRMHVCQDCNISLHKKKMPTLVQSSRGVHSSATTTHIIIGLHLQTTYIVANCQRSSMT